MKSSRYIIPVNIGQGGYLLYDAFSRSYLSLTARVFEEAFTPGGLVKVDGLRQPLFMVLRDNGFIIDDALDERQQVLALKQASRLYSTSYGIIVNPTLDCNLRCPYCYEKHTHGTVLSDALLAAIGHHVELQHAQMGFKRFDLGFFGGEPMLRPQQVVGLIRQTGEFCRKQDVEFSVHFTSNGTILPEDVVSALEGIPVSFQITLDGNQSQHDQVRCFADGGHGASSFALITKHIGQIQQELPQAQLNLRLNYQEKTFDQIGFLQDFVATLDWHRVNFSLRKVWQRAMTADMLRSVRRFALGLAGQGFSVDMGAFGVGGTTCYADRLNSLLVNHDGLVFKCTARQFDPAHSVGRLTPTGLVEWEISKLSQYLFAATPQCCLDCKLLPVCPGICSQSVMEAADPQQLCNMEAGESIESRVVFEYKLRTAMEKARTAVA